MTSPPPSPARSIGSRAAVATLLLTVMLSGPAVARDDPEEGHFEVRTAYTELIDGVYYLSADIDYGLSPAALDALRSGVELTIEVQVQVFRDRRMWWDAGVADVRHRYQLSFHPLSQRYVIRELDTSDAESFASYREAIERLGRISDLPVIDEAALEPDKRYDVRMRIAIDVEELPSPLKVFAFILSEWELTSDWYRWTLRSSDGS